MKAIICSYDTRSGDCHSDTVATFTESRAEDAQRLLEELQARPRKDAHGPHFSIETWKVPHNPTTVAEIDSGVVVTQKARPIKIVVAGSRDFTDRTFCFATLDKLFGRAIDSIQIISGNARGADALGERWAARHGLTEENGGLVVMPAEWEKYGNRAGPVRNEEMAKIATHLVLFWDGRSVGSKHMLNFSLKQGLWVKVIYY